MQVFFLSWGGKNLRSHLVVQSTNVNVHVLGWLLSFDVFFFFSSINEVVLLLRLRIHRAVAFHQRKAVIGSAPREV